MSIDGPSNGSVNTTRQTTFACCPDWVLDATISSHAVRLYTNLHRFANKAGKAWPSRTTLAAKMRCSLATLDRAMRELVDLGAVTITKRWRNKAGGISTTRDSAHNELTSSLYHIQFDQPTLPLPATRSPITRDGTVQSPVTEKPDPLDRDPKESTPERKHKPSPTRRSRAATLSENWQPRIDDLTRLVDLGREWVVEEMWEFKRYMLEDGRKRVDWDAEALKWLRGGIRRRAEIAKRATNVTNLYGQRALFDPPQTRTEPGYGDRRRAWLDERIAERDAQNVAATPPAPAAEESPEAIRRRILRSLETA